jgi:uncharacterized protein
VILVLTGPLLTGYYFRLMSPSLPEFVDPRHCADAGKRFGGTAGVAELPRLVAVVSDPQGEVTFSLDFDRDERRRVRVRGRVQARLTLLCQRCLEPFVLTLDEPVALLLVESFAEMERVPEGSDPWWPPEGPEAARVRLLDVVEEQLLLALPQVPRHPDGACAPAVQEVPEALSGPAEATPRENPFAQLAALKRRDA